MLPGVNHCHLPNESNQHQFANFCQGHIILKLENPYSIFELDHLKFISLVVISGDTEVNSYSTFSIGWLVRNNLKISQGNYAGMDSCVNRDSNAWSSYIGNFTRVIKGKNSLDVY
jgi:hypothetical protein